MPRRTDPRWPRLFAGAAAFAAAELGAGLLLGGFAAAGRAESWLFRAFRPWLLLVAALFVTGLDGRLRAAFYLLVLTAAGLSEALLLAALGADPWAEMVRGAAAGLAWVAIVDLALRLGGALRGRPGRALAAAAMFLLMLVPGGMRPYERLALGPTAPRPAASRPPLLLLTGLPLVWGETGPFDPASRPVAALGPLEREFTVRAIDHLDARNLGADRLLLLAQPRALEPRELVDLDAWVRGGGRVLILADPDLAWPSELPPGDPRRPPPASLLSPLLDHWGVRLAPRAEREMVVDYLRDREAVRRLVLAAPGRFAAARFCRPASRDYLAVCAIGAGRASLVADADLLRDELWVGPTARGTERHARTSDNVLLLAGWLDVLAGIERTRTDRVVQWRRPATPLAPALLRAAIPILLLLGAAAAVALATRRRRIHRLIHSPPERNRAGTGR
ncbi:MAG: Gldg family protein [Allosphingosinicella sp.]